MQEKQLQFFGLQRARKKLSDRKIVLSLDLCTLAGVIIVILFFFTFLLGIRKGRNFSYPNRFYEGEEVAKEPKEENEAGRANIEQVNEVKTDQLKEEKTNLYVIQVASYTKENFANQEANKLKAKGYPVLVSQKGKYTVVFAGRFPKAEEAHKSLGLLRQKYRDCFVRKL